MLADFIRVLRAADIRVSPAEVIDAAAVIEQIGLGDRQLLKNALGHSLAKTESEKLAFGECFENYFSLPESHAPASQSNNSPPETQTEQSAQAEQQAGASLADMLEADNQAALQARMAQAADESGLREARLFTQQGLFARRIVEAMGLDALDARINQLRQSDAGDGRREQLEQGRAQLFDAVHDFVARQIAMRTKNAGRLLREEALSRLRLGNLDKSDMKIMRELIRKLAKRLATRHARRRKKARRGMLDVRRTLRANQAYDGMMFDLAWKRTKIERPKLIVMCDVSGSVAAISRFFLMFLYSLDEVMPKTRSFVFSNRCGEISHYMNGGDVEEVMGKALREFGGGSTDYGQAFADLSDAVLDKIDKRTTLMVLGDARSNFAEPGHLILKEMHARARRVIWLNPEPESTWQSGDSEMRRLAAYCTQAMVCNSIRHVERVLDDLLRQSV